MTAKNYIEQHKQDWGVEFAELLDLESRPEYAEIAALGCYTVMYEIADNFQDGKFRSEILSMLGISA
jgi:hypothetical protein